MLMYNLYDKLGHISHAIHISNDKCPVINVPTYNTNLTSNATYANEKVEHRNIDQFSYTVQKFREITIFNDSFMPLLKKN
jgi:hypothetical protein